MGLAESLNLKNGSYTRKFLAETDLLSNRVFIGLDLSITETGVAIISSSEIISFTIRHTKDMVGIERCINNARTIKAVIESLLASKYSISGVNIEGYAMGIRGGQVFNIGENGGLVKAALHELHIDYFITAPTTVKKFAVGKGVADKNLIIKRCLTEFGYDVDNDNEADAFILATMMAAKVANGPNLRRKYVAPSDLSMVNPHKIAEFRKECLSTMQPIQTVRIVLS